MVGCDSGDSRAERAARDHDVMRRLRWFVIVVMTIAVIALCTYMLVVQP
jgi:hypothetical protein